MDTFMGPMVPKTPPLSMPPMVAHVAGGTTPIQQALTQENFTHDSPQDDSIPKPRLQRASNAWQGQTCVDVNDHVVNCPICSQYYQNYSSMYIGIIILLGFIILIFLLKSILEIRR